MGRRLVLQAVPLGALAFWPASASATDYSIIARDFVPSGRYGSVPPPANATQQAQMYDALTPLFGHVTASDLLADFKPDKLGSAAVGVLTAESVPRAGVTITRDPYQVPQIRGTTRDEQGPNPAGRHSSATAERISFVPGLLTAPGTSAPFTMRYTDRPSGIQQVLSFYGHAPQDTGR
jgi:hypothetical protein